MSGEETHVLTNSFLAVRLIALHEQPEFPDEGVGPFLVVQRGLDPEDVEVVPGDFVLTRNGTWLRVEAFVGLGWEEGHEMACFPSAAEVIRLMEELPPRPTVARGSESQAESSDPDAGDQAFFTAVIRAVRGPSGIG